MNHSFKLHSLQALSSLSRLLLIACMALSMALLFLSIKVLTDEEHWVLIPAAHIETKLPLSSKAYSETYLREWGLYVMQTLMTVSHDTVDAQIQELKNIAHQSDTLASFFAHHADWIRGSRIEMVFFPKKAVVEDKHVTVRGTFRYWLGHTDQSVAQEKSYRLHYKRGVKGLLFLTAVEEVTYA